MLEQPAPSAEDKLAIVAASSTNELGQGRDLGVGGGNQDDRRIEILNEALAVSREQMDQYGRENAELRSRLQV